MRTGLKNNKKGFTIVEVMIVLAIGGLIMLIVFLAVPALQRNQRNTRRRSDVGRVLSLISEYQTNNNGVLPTTEEFNAAFPNEELSSYDMDSDVEIANTNAEASLTGIRVVTGFTCDGNTPQSGGGSRSFVAVWAVENSSGAPVPQCTAS